MNFSQSAWFVIMMAALAANLPFVNQRLLALIPLSWAKKPVWVRLVELSVLYFVVGLIGLAMEKSIGSVHPQTWEFYPITAGVFLVLAYPGFVYRYLIRRHQHD